MINQKVIFKNRENKEEGWEECEGIIVDKYLSRDDERDCIDYYDGNVSSYNCSQHLYLIEKKDGTLVHINPFSIIKLVKK